MAHPDNVFGPDLTDAVKHDDVLAYVKRMKPRDMPLSSYDDVITILEYVQQDVLRTQEEQTARDAALSERERKIKQLEQQLSIRKRAIDMMLHEHEAPPRRKFWAF